MLGDKLKAIALETNPDLSIVDVEVLLLKDGVLTIELDCSNGKIVITSDDSIGHRVLDEGDLLEFWPNCALTNGWLYEIGSGGWKDLEATRGGFLSGDSEELSEYLVVTENTCVNLISYKKPRVSYVT